jgi:glyoxylase-like metal-dependent hydrolase (beta-lactamase superfamily II)
MAIIEHLSFPYTNGAIKGVRVGRFNKGINTTFIVYAYNDVLIDTGPINQWRFVKAFITEQNINHTLVTHHHEDHSGNAFNISDELKVPVYSNLRCQQQVKQTFDIPMVQKIIWGTAKPVDTLLLEENFTSTQGVNLQILLTPGHTQDMSCFFDAEHGFLFTGDLYIASKVRYFHKDEDLTKQLISLNKVITLDFNTAFCPHRGIMKNGKQDIIKKRDFIVDLAQQVQTLAAQGLPTKQIKKQLLGKEDLFTLISKFHFTKQGLIQACLTLPKQLIS